MSLTDSELVRLKAAKKNLDFEFVEFGTYRNPMHPDSAIRAGYIRECIGNIEACERVGCRCIGVTAGSRYMPTMNAANNFAADPDNWTLASWKLSVDYFKQVLNATRGMKTTLGIEANVTSILDTPLAHKNFIEDLADERVSVVFDPSNSIHLFNYYRNQRNADRMFRHVGRDD
jgi:sugar phosphate isomerase/epimerase